jgi:hypothetical protein
VLPLGAAAWVAAVVLPALYTYVAVPPPPVCGGGTVGIGVGCPGFTVVGATVGAAVVAVGAAVLVGLGVGVGFDGAVVGVGAEVAVAATVGVLVGGIGVAVGVFVGGPGGGGIVVATKVGGGGGVLAAALVWPGVCIALATATIPTASGTVNPMVNRLFMQDSLRSLLRSDRLVAQMRLPPPRASTGENAAGPKM